jgi:hypothetical protein
MQPTSGASVSAWRKAKTSSDLEKKYGIPVKEYEVRPAILMTATYF